jgi:hypothetical protein
MNNLDNQTSSRGATPPREDEATPVKEIKSQHARTRLVSMGSGNIWTLLSDLNASRLDTIISNGSAASSLRVCCSDDQPSAGDYTTLLAPGQEWRLPAHQYIGRIWGQWVANSGSKIPNSDWALASQPAAGAMATVTKGAVAGVRHVITALVATVSTNAATAGGGTLVFRDGNSGSGPIFFEALLTVQAVSSQENSLVLTPATPIPSPTSGNALTIEFASVPGATISESISVIGYDLYTGVNFIGDENALVTEFS